MGCQRISSYSSRIGAAIVLTIGVLPFFSIDAEAEELLAEERAIIDQIVIDETTPNLADVIAEIGADETTLDSGGLNLPACACDATPNALSTSAEVETFAQPMSPGLMVTSPSYSTTITDEKDTPGGCCEKVRVTLTFELTLKVKYLSTSPLMAEWIKLGTIYKLPELATITPKYTAGKEVKLERNRKWEGCENDWAAAKKAFKEKVEKELAEKVEFLKKNKTNQTVTVEVELVRKDNNKKERVKITFNHLCDVEDGSFKWLKEEIVPIDGAGKPTSCPVEDL